MLKIREDIELKELEKFGFKHKLIGEDDWNFERYEKGRIFISVNRREIHSTSEDDTLYDLIQAGIVVKV